MDHLQPVSDDGYGKHRIVLISVWNVFEDENVPVILANAHNVKAVPGRKTDKGHAEWLAQLLSEGHIQPGFIPDRKHRELRALVIQRAKYIRERASEINRAQKILAASNTQLSNVVSNIYGKSAQVLLDETLENVVPTPERIQQLTDEVRFILIRTHIECLDQQILKYTAKISSVLDDKEQARVQLIASMTGIGQDSARVINSIIGTDMGRFGSPDKLCSWAGVVPGNNESAGKRKSSRTTKGHALLKSTLVVCANSAAHSRNTFLVSRCRRLVVRLGAKKAIMAIAHSMLKAIWYMLSSGELYNDLGEGYCESIDKDRKIRAHINKLQKLGMDTQSLETQLDKAPGTATWHTIHPLESAGPIRLY